MIFTIILSILTLNYDFEILEIILNISIGLFASTIVALLLNIPAYNVSKRQLLERFWEESRRLISSISKVDFLLNEYDDKTVINYINALNNKKWIEVYNEISKEQKIDNKEEVYKQELIDSFILNNSDLKEKISESGFKKYADEQIDKYIEKLRKKADKIYQQYSELSKESTIELDFLLGDLEFISGIKPYKKIYEKMYQPLFNTLNKIKEECFHFKLYLDGKGNEAVVLEKLFNLQRELFTITEKENGQIKSLIVMGTFVDNMLINLEEFRADMYNIKPEEQNPHPITCVTYNKNS